MVILISAAKAAPLAIRSMAVIRTIRDLGIRVDERFMLIFSFL
jgi:hypothetical protein